MLLDYDRADIKASKLRIKEWDYYLVTNDEFAVALTISDNAYMGLMSASIIDFKEVREKTNSELVLFPMSKTDLPSSSKQGISKFKNKNVDFSFEKNENERHLKVRYNRFDGDDPFFADIVLTDEPADSMVIATPFEKPKAFYYNQKIIGMKAKGTAEFAGKTYTFDNADSFGLLDWGRGVWTYDNTWYWGAGQGLVQGKVFGFNIGYGFGDTSAASENMLFYDGAAHKLDGVSFNIPQNVRGGYDFVSPWTFTSTDGRFEMDFKPIIDRAALISLAVLKSDQHQVFGTFTGKAVLDDGTVLEIKDFLGFAEKVHNKY
jgi:hypothetical protein